MDNNKANLIVAGRIKSPKLLMIISTIVALVSNVVIIVSHAKGGYDFKYFILPIVMGVLDIAYLALTFLVNYRFAKTGKFPFIYLAASGVITVALICVSHLLTNIKIFTTLAICGFAVIHLVAIVAEVFCYLHATKKYVGRGGVKRSTVVFTIILLAVTVAYCVMVALSGWFGQGEVGVERPLEFTLTEDGNGFKVTGVLNSRGDTVVVPAEFNGKPVTAVDCSIFETEFIKNIYFKGDISYENLDNPKFLYSQAGGRTIYAKNYDGIRNGFFLNAYNAKNEQSLEIANTVIPFGLEENQVYVTFTYTYADLLAVKGEALKTWVGNKGDIITENALDGVSYVAYKFDSAKQENSQWSYNNINKKIYLGAGFASGTGFGVAVSNNIDNVTLNFESLYMVNLKEDNDTIYEVEDSFKYFDAENKISNVFTKAQAIAWFDSYETREGFELAWLYGNEASKDVFGGMNNGLADGLNLYPQWTMKAPTITNISTNGTLVYGQTAELNSTSEAAMNDFVLTYEWTFGGEVVNRLDSFTIPNARPNKDHGTYTLKVVSSYAGSSLTSETSKSIDVVVNKRGINIDWTYPNDSDDNPGYAVYTATDKVAYWLPSADATETEGVINSDVITFKNESTTMRNVGIYDFSIELSGECAELYYLIGSQNGVLAGESFTITPAQINTINWGELTFIYNARTQAPTATADGLGDDGVIQLVIAGSGIDAGSYDVFATSSNPNYVVYTGDDGEANKEVMVINPLGVDVTWEHVDDLIYNGTLQSPTATATGIDDVLVNFVVSGAIKDATAGEATVNLDTTGNYIANNKTQAFSIAKRQLEFTWNYGTEETYKAEEYDYQIIVSNAVNGENLTFTYTYEKTGGANIKPIKVGTDYKVKVVLAADNVSGDDVNKNYVIEEAESELVFTIVKRSLVLDWTNADSFVYDGTALVVNVISYGISPTVPGYNSMIAELADGFDYTGNVNTNASDSYVATASLKNSISANYTIESGSSCEYAIAKREISANWQLPDERNDLIFDGNAWEWTVVFENTVSGQTPVISITYKEKTSDEEESPVNAGTYVATVALTGALVNENYIIKSSSATREYSVAKREITAVWTLASVRELTFDGKSWQWNVTFENTVSGHVPVFTISYTETNDVAPVNAGTYTGTVALTSDVVNNNYVIKTASVKNTFTVNQRPVDIVWENLSFVFDGEYHIPTAYYTDVNNNKQYLTVTEQQRNAMSGYLAVATTTDVNYAYNKATNTFDITPMQVTINWNVPSFIYNGKVQMPTATMSNDSGTVSIDNVTVELNTGSDGKNAGLHTVIAKLNTNYEIIQNVSYQYEISPKSVDVIWGDKTEFVFNSKEQKPSASFIDVETKNIVLTVTGGAVDVGDYTATASTTDKNYELIGATKSFSIEAAQAEVKWENTTVVYNGVIQQPKAYYMNVNNVRVDLEVLGSLIDVGNISVTVSHTDDNYVISNTTSDFAVTPKPVNVVWGNNKFVYNGEAQVPSATYNDVKGNVITLTVNGAMTDVGTNYPATAVGNDDNYSLNNPNTTFSISVYEAAVIWENTEFIFDGQPHKPTAYFMDVNGHRVDITVTGEQTNARTSAYTANATHDDKNYRLTNTSSQYTISPKTVAVIWENLEFTYDGKSHVPEAYYMDVTSSRVYLTVNGAKTNASTKPYTATAYGTDNNYKLEGVSEEYVINPLDVVIEWSNTDLIYNGSAQKPSAVIKDTLGGNVTLIAPTVSVISGNGKDASVHTAQVRLSSNFNIISGETTTFVITPLEVSVVWENTELVYNGKVQKPSAYFTGIAGKVTLTVEGDINAINVGSYYATASTTDLNYSLTNEICTYEITALTVVVAWNNTSLVYNGRSQAPTAFFMDPLNKKINLDVTGAQSDVGNYNATTSYDSDNIILTNATMRFDITPKPVSVVWENTSLVYNGAAQMPSAYFTGVDGRVDLTVECNNAVNVGSHNATASTTNGNYELSNTTASLTITAKPVNVVWENTTSEFNGQSQKPSAYFEGVDGRVDLAVECNNAVNVSTYSATASTTDPNYSLSNTTTQFKITPVTREVIWENTSLSFNNKAQKPTAYIINVDGVKTEITVKTTTTAVNVGTYSATASTTDNNYTLTNTSAQFEITAVTGDVIWENTNLVYNGVAQKPSAYIMGVDGRIDLTVTADSQSINVGKYNATASLSGNNYVLTNTSTEFEITAKEVLVTWENTELVYNGSLQAPTAYFIDVNGGKVTLEVSGAMTDVGTYEATVSYANANYDVKNITTSFTITELEVAVTWSADNVPSIEGIDESLYSVTYRVQGGEESQTKPETAGTYTVTITLNSGNHKLSSDSETERTFVIEEQSE